jgi:hypothetical protein
MKTAKKETKEAFDLHLAQLRELAKKKGVHFADVLAVLVSPHNQMRIADFIGTPEESKLIKQYWPKFYLDYGRRKGAADRKAEAQVRHEDLNKAIDDLFDKPDKRGWRMTNEDIADYLLPTFPNYKHSTILKAVKPRAAMHRKAEKIRQASKVPNRY